MLYNLVRKIDGKVEDGHANLTAIQLAETASKIKISVYNIVEVKDALLKEKSLVELSPKEQEYLLNDFKKTMTTSQVNDVTTGIKKIVYSQNIGYHLRTIDKQENEIYVSIEKQKLDKIKEVERFILEQFKDRESEIYVNYRLSNIILAEDFSEIFNNFVKRIR